MTVSRAIEGQRKTIPHLMDLEGKIKSGKAPDKPHPPTLFDTIKVPDLPAPPGSKLGVWRLPTPDMEPISDVDRERRLRVNLHRLREDDSEDEEEDGDQPSVAPAAWEGVAEEAPAQAPRPRRNKNRQRAEEEADDVHEPPNKKPAKAVPKKMDKRSAKA